MVLPEIRLLQAAIALAEELNFSRAAERLGIDQSTLSKRILELDHHLGFRLFERNHQFVELTDAGRHFVEEARGAVLHAERAVSNATAVFRRADEILNVGKSLYTDPYLVTALLSVRLPLFPGLQIKLWSNYSHELARDVIAGKLSMALITAVPDAPKLNLLTVAEHPVYIAMSIDDPLASREELHLQDLDSREWILPAQHARPYLYELIQLATSEKGITASDTHSVMAAEEAAELILARGGIAFLTRTEAWRIARDEITMRPLVEERLRLVTKLATRTADKSRLVGEFVRAAGRKLSSAPPVLQARLPLGG